MAEQFIFYDKNYSTIDDVKKASHFRYIMTDEKGDIIEETIGDIE